LDEFFQRLREIQKKERNLSGLSQVGDSFYQDVSNYLNSLMKKIDNNPFSFESYLLRDAQRITAEICERREHKITNSAVMNVQRSHQLFKDSNSSEQSKIPLNSTPEEEKLYHALVASLVTYREKMMGPLKSYTPKNHSQMELKSEILVDTDKRIVDSDEKIVDTDKKDKNQPGDVDKIGDVEYKDDLEISIKSSIKSEEDIYKEFGKEPVNGKDPIKKSIKSSGSLKGQDELPKTSDIMGDVAKDIKDVAKDHKPSKSADNSQKVPTEILMILEELPPIMGVDKKVYGPLSPQDIIAMPQPNATILIKNHKGRSIQRYK
jgi:DNA replication factor GINS